MVIWRALEKQKKKREEVDWIFGNLTYSVRRRIGESNGLSWVLEFEVCFVYYDFLWVLEHKNLYSIDSSVLATLVGIVKRDI